MQFLQQEMLVRLPIKTDKTVGVVCLAIATPNGVFSEEFDFGSPREKVIHRSSNKILELLRKEIIKKNY